MLNICLNCVADVAGHFLWTPRIWARPRADSIAAFGVLASHRFASLRRWGRKGDHVEDETHPYRCSLRRFDHRFTDCRQIDQTILDLENSWNQETVAEDTWNDDKWCRCQQQMLTGKPLEPTDAHHRPSKAGGLSARVSQNRRLHSLSSSEFSVLVWCAADVSEDVWVQASAQRLAECG